MEDPADPFQLERFLEAQRETYDTALTELQAGAKQSHWMWFIFPQLAGLGRSPTAIFYGLRSLHEARAFLAHPLLGERYRECLRALCGWTGSKSAAEILGAENANWLIDSVQLH